MKKPSPLSCCVRSSLLSFCLPLRPLKRRKRVVIGQGCSCVRVRSLSLRLFSSLRPTPRAVPSLVAVDADQWPWCVLRHPQDLAGEVNVVRSRRPLEGVMEAMSTNPLFFWDWRWLTTALVFVLFYAVARFYNKVSKYHKGPFPLPIIGNLLTLANTKSLHVQAEKWAKEYGDPFTLWMGEKPMLFLNSHKVIKEAFIDKRHEFAGRFPTKLGALQTRGHKDIVFEDYNPTWKALKKVALGAVRKYAASETLEKQCSEVVDAYVDGLEMGQNTVNSRDPFQFFFFNIIGMSVYGMKFDSNSKEIAYLMESNNDFSRLAPNGLPSDIVPWLGILFHFREKEIEALFANLTHFLGELYKKAAKTYVSGEATNFTHSMLAAREEAIKQEKNDAQYLAEMNMVQILVDAFLAGSDTSIGELQWLCLTLSRQPSIQTRIQKEIEDNIGKMPPTRNDKEKLPFTVACLFEILRLYPIVPLGLPHNTCCDTQAGGKFIPKNTGILYNIHAMNHDPEFWEDPEVFRPERFLDSSTGRLKTVNAPQIFTFGLGARSCPGEKLAQMDMFLVLVRLMQRVSFSAPPGKEGTHISPTGSSIFLIPAKQDVIVTRRN